MDALDLIASLRRGMTAEELAQACADAVRHVENSGKPAVITYKLTFKPGGQGQMIVEDAIESKLAPPSRESTLFFVGLDGGLTRKSPRQMTLSEEDDR